MLTYVEHGRDKLAIRGDKLKYHKTLKEIGARWNGRLKGGEGWTISNEHRDRVDELIQTIGKEDILDEISDPEHMRNKDDQDKFHRSGSDTEDFEITDEFKEYIKPLLEPLDTSESEQSDDGFPEYELT